MTHEFDINAAPLTTVQLQQKIKECKNSANALRVMAIVFALVAWACGLYFVAALFFVALAFGVAAIACAFAVCPYENVAVDDCEDLLKACYATPEGQDYRLAVIEQGRQFVNGELQALHAWAESANARAACRKVYAAPPLAT
jgi:hypothetical protein